MRVRRKPELYALVLAGAYLLASCLYIVASGWMAAALADSVEELARLEAVKGLLFVAVTSLGLGAGAYVLFRRIFSHADELMRTREALVTTQQRAFAGIVASSIAHDCNNLFVVMQGGIDALRGELRDTTSSAAKEVLDEVTLCIDELVLLVRQLSAFGKDQSAGTCEDIELGALAEETLRMVRIHPTVRSCSIRVNAKEPVPLRGYPSLIRQVITNLVLNAADSVGERGRVEVRVLHVEGWPCLEVHDDGPGVPLPQRERVFEPFFTTKHHGSGLGLLSVKACAQSHGGRIELDDSPLGGACFRVLFPERPRPGASGASLAGSFQPAHRFQAAGDGPGREGTA